MNTAVSMAGQPSADLLDHIYGEIVSDRAQLPSMPDVALKIHAAMQSPDYTAGTVAKVIMTDPATTAYIIRIANSALYRGVVPIQDVETAVSRMGMRSARNLVTAFALRSMFHTRSRVLADIMRDGWRKSARLAALASVIAGRCKGFSSDRALLAGLFQDIGVLPLLSVLEADDGAVREPQVILDLIEALSARLGAVLLEHWEFDPEMIAVAQSRGDWWRDPKPQADLADLVIVARLHAAVGSDEMQELPRINEVPAFGKLPLGDVGPDASLDFLREADAEVRDVMKMLGV